MRNSFANNWQKQRASNMTKKKTKFHSELIKINCEKKNSRRCERLKIYEAKRDDGYSPRAKSQCPKQ